MKDLLRNRVFQKCMLPSAFVMIGIVWLISVKGNARTVPCYILVVLGLVCLILDRKWKPWQQKKN